MSKRRTRVAEDTPLAPVPIDSIKTSNYKLLSKSGIQALNIGNTKDAQDDFLPVHLDCISNANYRNQDRLNVSDKGQIWQRLEHTIVRAKETVQFTIREQISAKSPLIVFACISDEYKKYGLSIQSEYQHANHDLTFLLHNNLNIEIELDPRIPIAKLYFFSC